MELSTKRIKLSEALPNQVEQLASKHGLKPDEVELVRKGGVSEKVDVEEGERAAVQWVSTRGIDRDGEVVLPAGWNLSEFEATGRQVMWGHDYSRPPIGKDLWIKKHPGTNPRGLLAKTVYAETPFASEIFQLKQGGFLNTSSVGFIPLEHLTKDDEGWNTLLDKLAGKWPELKEGRDKLNRVYTKALLLEHSDVSVPSNPEALVVAVSKGLIVSPELAKELEIITKPEETENYIHVPAPGQEGKHDGHRIRTITISEEEGIKGRYCGECKKMISYMFDKDKNWTMARAQAWVREHEKNITFDGDVLVWTIERESIIVKAVPIIDSQPKKPTMRHRVTQAVQDMTPESVWKEIKKGMPELVQEEIDRMRGRL